MEHLDHYCGPEPSKVTIDTLRRRSGLAPGGFPTFRVVHTEHVFEQSGGEWSDWADEVAIDDRGRLSNILDADGKPIPIAMPIRVVTELRTVPKYSHLDPGWILERWFPAHMNPYSPEMWEANVVPGSSIPRWGPYPDRGFYVMLCGTFPEEPSIDFLQDFISFHEKKTQAIMQQDVELYIRHRCEQRQKQHEEKQEKALNESIARMKEASSYLLGTSLAAGRLRNKAAEKIGLKSHVGN